MAEAHQIAVAPHNPNGPIATAAAIHFAAATPNWIIQEAITNDVPWRNDVVINPVEVVSGHAAIPTRAGLGIDINEDEAARHPFKPEAMQRSFHADGAVADW
jgi:galactonate dehydratase